MRNSTTFVISLCFGIVICTHLNAQEQPDALQAVADYASYRVDGSTVLVQCRGTHKVKITACRSDIIRVEYDPKGTFLLDPYSEQDLAQFQVKDNSNTIAGKTELASDILAKQWPSIPIAVTDEGEYLKIAASDVCVRLYKSPLRIHFYDASNTTLINKDEQTMKCSADGSALLLSKTQSDDEHFFGFANGCRGFNDEFSLDYAGSFEGPNPEKWHYKDDETYGTPFFYSTAGYGLFVVFEAPDGNEEYINVAGGGSRWDFTNSRFYTIERTASPYNQHLLYFFIHGPAWEKVMNGYTDISGRTPLFQKKFFGVGANTRMPCEDGASGIETMIERYRDEGYPLDLLISEQCYGWRKWWMRQWVSGGPMDRHPYYPDPGDPYWAGAKNKNPEELHTWLEEQGVLIGANTNEYFSHRSDADEVAYMVDHGFDVYWRDMMHDGRGYIDAKTQYRNVVDALDGDESRAFVRNGWVTWVGQRFAVHHVGDRNMPRENAFKSYLAISMGGYPFNHIDLALKEWHILSHALMPTIYYHQSGTGVCTQPWGGYGCRESTPDETDRMLYQKWMRFHERMVPYLYTYSAGAHETGIPVWRHMVCYEPKKRETYTLDYQAYVGDWLIVAPSKEGEPVRVYLPDGVWYDFFEGTKYQGPTTLSYDVEGYKLPLFARAGAIIPMAPSMDYIGEKPEDPLTLRLWPRRRSHFTIWEDHNRVTTDISSDDIESQTRITIPSFQGSAHAPASRRYILEVHTDGRKPQKVVRNNTEVLPALSSLQEFQDATEGWFFDASRGGICHVKPDGNNATGFSVVLSYDGTLPLAHTVKQSPAGYTLRSTPRHLVADIASFSTHRIECLDVSGKIVYAASGKGNHRYTIPRDVLGEKLVIIRFCREKNVTIDKRIFFDVR